MPKKSSSKQKKAPTIEDAQLLLKLNDIQQSDRVFRGWAFSQMEFNVKSWKEFLEKYPKGSEGYDSYFAVGHFLEISGVLLKYGLISEDLFFDTFYFEPIWKNFEPVIISMREEFQEPSLEENFEFLYNRFQGWKKSREVVVKN